MIQTTQYDGIGREYATKVNPTKEYTRLSTILNMTGSLKDKEVLDLACGDGYFTRLLVSSNPYSITGIDLSNEMIRLAKQTETDKPLGITYCQGDALNLQLNKTFDVIIAVFLLDYAKTKNELVTMCKEIYKHLKEDGIFATITITPKLQPRETYIRGWKITNLDNRRNFFDGDKIGIFSDPAHGSSISFECYYWSEKTYLECLRSAGFKDINWQYELTVSEEGNKKYPKEYWEDAQRSTAAVGIKATK
jgi:ubiquinone/menaquinone biosynthesis C-methylase UbiE